MSSRHNGSTKISGKLLAVSTVMGALIAASALTVSAIAVLKDFTQSSSVSITSEPLTWWAQLPVGFDHAEPDFVAPAVLSEAVAISRSVPKSSAKVITPKAVNSGKVVNIKHHGTHSTIGNGIKKLSAVFRADARHDLRIFIFEASEA